jgi:hypothetical protein
MPELVYAHHPLELDEEIDFSSPGVADIGEKSPSVRLPDLSGHMVDLANPPGTATLILFWAPACGHCQRMRTELIELESNPPPGAPQLLVISSGTVDESNAIGLQAPVLVDRNFVAGRAFGVTGTPSALLIGADGRIASRVAAGAPAVLALAGRFRTGFVATTTPECERCLEECRTRGGGEACIALCTISGECD